MENTQTLEDLDVYAYPNQALLLETAQGRHEFPTQNVLITNIFKDDVPLYYAHRLTYYHYDNQGPDPYGMYQGSGIVIVDRLGNPIDRPYRVQLIPNGHYNLYDAIVFTSFDDQESDTYSVVYNAVRFTEDGRTETLAGYKEKLNLDRAFSYVDSIYDLLPMVQRRGAYPYFHQAQGTNPSYSKFYVPAASIKDTRRPQHFRYRIGVEIDITGGKDKGKKYVFATPWHLGSVLNVNSLTANEEHEYVNGSKQVTEKTAHDILMEYVEDTYFFHVYAKKKYFVICDNELVKTFTRLDGSSPVFAKTDANTHPVDGVFVAPIKTRITYDPLSEAGLALFRVRPMKGPDKTTAFISFIIDGSKSIQRFDGDGGFRADLIRSIAQSGQDFYGKVKCNGFYYNYENKVIQAEFSDNVEAFIDAFQKVRKDDESTDPFASIDEAIVSLEAVTETYIEKPKRTIVLLTDGEYLDYQKVKERVEAARAKGISLCIVTFNNMNRLSPICAEYNTICLDALSAGIGMDLRYFFFNLSGVEESHWLQDPSGNVIRERIDLSPLENDFALPKSLDEYLQYVDPSILQEKMRYGFEVILKDARPTLESPDANKLEFLKRLPEANKMTVYFMDVPENRILPAQQGADIISLSVMDKPTPYMLYVRCESYEAKFHHTYSLRFLDSDQIRVLPPKEEDANLSWYLRVKNGRFERKVQEKDGSSIVYKYSIPEYYRQNFLEDRGVPYMKAIAERPKVLNESQIKLLHTPLYIETKNGLVRNIEVLVNGSPIRVRTWDTFNGILTLDGTITANDEIYVTYEYEENSFVYRGYYDEENKRFWSLDLNPSVGHYVTIRDRHDKEIKDVPSFALINETIYLYIRPSMKMIQTKRESQLRVPSLSATFMDLDNTNYTKTTGAALEETLLTVDVKSYTLFHTFEKINDPEAILLGRIHVRPNSSQSSLQIIDTRVRGGGLKPEITQAIMQEFEEESKFYWDIGHWDGKPYSENAVVVIRISRRILKEYGGRFTKSEVEEKLDKHLGYGVLAILEFIEDSDELLQIPTGFVVEVIDVEDKGDVDMETPTFALKMEG